MSGGRTIFSGNRSDLPRYMGSVGFPCPPFKNPADYYCMYCNISYQFTTSNDKTHVLSSFYSGSSDIGRFVGGCNARIIGTHRDIGQCMGTNEFGTAAGRTAGHFVFCTASRCMRSILCTCQAIHFLQAARCNTIMDLQIDCGGHFIAANRLYLLGRSDQRSEFEVWRSLRLSSLCDDCLCISIAANDHKRCSHRSHICGKRYRIEILWFNGVHCDTGMGVTVPKWA